ncbi:MAG: hypothetical protein M0Z85_12375 [Gammaproteobacteria bacterium]|nr:hypothetical protein [Gammaproteobacteria bacterium]
MEHGGNRACGKFALRRQDAQSDASACPEKGPKLQDNAEQPERLVVHPYVTAAIARYVEGSNGDIEVDLDAVVSKADGGASPADSVRLQPGLLDQRLRLEESLSALSVHCSHPNVLCSKD